MAWRDWKIVRSVSRFLMGKPKPKEFVVEAQSSPKDRSKGIIKKIGLAFVGSSGSSGRLNFEGPTGFSFDEIEKAYLTDSYIRQACDKYVDYMFKAGYDIVGKNPKAVDYIKLRLAAMAVATEKPLSEFLTEVAEDLVRYHNVFIVKARAGNSYMYPPGIKATPVLSNKTVAGYYVLPVSTVTIARDLNGTVKKYKQEIKGGSFGTKSIEISPDDMIHIAIDRPQGRAFGFPFIWQALDDVKLLRQMEELTDRMVYKNLFPLLHYKVGLDKEGFQATDEEVEEVKAQLAELPLDGGIVTSERHTIIPIGVGDKVIDVAPYLEYFKKRVFTGLGVSATIMGEGDTVNKSTSDNLDQMFKDRIKAFQKVIEENFNAKIMYELLLEGGFDPLVKPEDSVELKFREIDLRAKMAEQNHIVQLFTQNAITHEQLRLLLGYDPVTPEEENRLYYRMITIPTAIETKDATSSEDDAEAANNAGQNKNQPANQYGSRTSAKTTKNSLSEAVVTQMSTSSLSVALQSRYESLKADVIKQVKQHISKGRPLSEFNKTQIELTCRLASDHMASIGDKYTGPAFIEGVSEAQKQSGKNQQTNVNLTYNIELMREDFKKQTSKFVEALMSQVEKVVRNSNEQTAVQMVVGAFDALQYRLRFMSTTQVYNSYNIGFAKAARDLGYEEAYLASPELGCEVCGKYAAKAINLLSDRLPPFHPNCSCKLTLRKEGG